LNYTSNRKILFLAAKNGATFGTFFAKIKKRMPLLAYIKQICIKLYEKQRANFVHVDSFIFHMKNNFLYCPRKCSTSLKFYNLKLLKGTMPRDFQPLVFAYFSIQKPLVWAEKFLRKIRIRLRSCLEWYWIAPKKFTCHDPKLFCF